MNPELSPKLKRSSVARKGDAVLIDDNTASGDGRQQHHIQRDSLKVKRASYPGGKNGAGVYQNIISLMPPHETYIEAFLGGGAIMRLKRPAARNIGIDLDAAAVNAFPSDAVPRLKLIEGDALSILRAWRFEGDSYRHTLAYIDPPYLMSTRRQHRPLYRCELSSEADHVRLLEILMNLPCMVMLSGYHSKLYDRALSHWRREEFYTSDRGGNRRLEVVWMNFAEPLELHDYRYLGRGFRERERIKRKRLRWRARLERMPSLERHALMATIDELRHGSNRQE